MKTPSPKQLTERDLEALLTPRERPVPPADLAARIKREIPEQLPALPGQDGAERPDHGYRVWLMAAGVALAVSGGFLGLRLMGRLPAPAAESIQAVTVVPERQPPEYRPPAAGRTAAQAPPEADSDAVAAGPTAAGAESEPRPKAKRIEPPATRSDKLEAPRNREAGRRQDEGSAASPPPELFDRRIEVEAKTSMADVAASQPGVAAEAAEPEIVVTSEWPVVESRQEQVAAPEAALGGVTFRGAAPRVERDPAMNARVAEMPAEANKPRAKLDAFEVAVAPPPAPPSPAPSTGGNAEPNDAPYGDVFFEGAGTNPFIDTEDDALSTFGLDVDSGSYTVVRRYLADGHLPPPAAVRVEEFINYFDYGDAAPATAEFAIHAEGAPSIYGEGGRYHLLRFNLSGRQLGRAERRPALLTFVVDVSGSMGQGNRLDLVKQALALLIDQLRADDRLALVIYGSRGQVVLEPTADHGAIRRAIDRLRTGGSTNAEEGLELAYELAARHRRRGAINRVILCSDGVANVGATAADTILDRIRREADQGVELTTVGFGMGNYNDVLMERLADSGNGRYAYVDTLDEARRIFVEHLTGTLQTLAAEARVQVEFNPVTVARYRLLGYENRDIADQRFRDDTVDAGEIGVGHKVTALYEIKLHRQPRAGDRIATLRLRYGSVERREMVELERAVTGADFARRWQDASPALKLTSLVAEYAEILKRSYWARQGDLDDVFRRAQRLSAQFEGDREVADFVSLAGRAAQLQGLE